MAITRAQQAKQLLKEGGRTGFFTAGLAAGENISPGTSTSGGFKGGPPGGGDSNMTYTAPSQDYNPNIPNPDGTPSRFDLANAKEKPPVKVPPPKPKKTKDNTLPTLNTAEKFKVFNLKKAYEKKMGLTPNVYGVVPNLLQAVTPNKLDFYEESEDDNDMSYYGMSGDDITDADRLAEAINEAEKTGNITQTEFENAFYGPDGPPQIVGGGEDNQVMDPCKGPNPPAYCFIDQNADDTTEEEPFQRNFRLMADGGRAEFAEGGIMPRLSDLSGNVSSAEQMLQEINQRLESAESTLGEGGGMQQPALQQPIGQPGLNNSRTAGLEQLEAIRIGSLPNNQFNVDPMSGPLQPALPSGFKQLPNGGMLGPTIPYNSNNTPRYSSFEEMMKNRIQSDIPRSFTNLEGVRSNPDGTPYTPPDNNQILSLMTNQTPGGPMQSPLQTALGLADGGRAALAEGGMPYEGGIMDLESSRQMYGLGKLVKKVTRSVKKIAKSPIGKAALLYFGGNALAGGGLKSFLLGSNAGPSFSKTGLLQKMFLKNPSTGFSLGNLSGTAVAGIPAALSYFMTPEEEEQQAMNYGADIDDPRTIMANPSLYTNRRLAAEGGSMDEPVAKKTMPLLDMDGQEMDLRAEGGFVPIGRMEKADDVPARLSKNEFVFTAEAVRNAGEGDVDKGAEVMYNMMKNLESGGEVSEESQGLEGAREMFQTSQRLEEVI